MHTAKPVKLSVEGEVLENAEDTHQETKNHPEPNEAAPVLKCAESLHGEEEEAQVGDKKHEFHPCAVVRRCAMKKPLAANDQGKSCQRRDRQCNNKMMIDA